MCSKAKRDDLILTNLAAIRHQIDATALQCGRSPQDIELLAITKNQTPDKILPLLQEGQRQFGENRVQEAQAKWPAFKQLYPNIQLHLVGHLQTNKAKEAVALFDVIETLDSLKLADQLAQAELQQKKHLSYYIEINLGAEPQKSGILPQEFSDFMTQVTIYSLNIIGVMCIPPQDHNPRPYFQALHKIALAHCLSQISMGMSQDYCTAIEEGATLVRVGHALFAQHATGNG